MSHESQWRPVRLGDICEFKYGKALPAASRQDNGEVPVYGSSGIVGHHVESLTRGSTVIVGRKGSLGEVHYCGTSCWPIDTTYYIDATCTQQHLGWLAHRLAGLGLTKLNRAAAVPGLNREDAYRQTLLLPPLAAQRRIAEVLDRGEDLRAKRLMVLDRLRDLPDAIFQNMFGSSMTDRAPWAIRELREVVREGTIVTYGIVQAGDEFPGGVPYIRTGDLVAGEILTSTLRHTRPDIAARFGRSRVETGDIVMSIRATVGTTALVPPELDGANLTQGTARIAPGPDTDRRYLLHLLRSSATQSWIQRQVKGATFREITLNRLRELPVLLPPLHLQREFSLRAATVEKLMSSCRQSLEKTNELFDSVRHRAFRGEM